MCNIGKRSKVCTELKPITLFVHKRLSNSNRVLSYLLLNEPESVQFEDFSNADNYTRTLEDIWSTWNEHRLEYKGSKPEDTPVNSGSRKFIVWLLRW